MCAFPTTRWSLILAAVDTGSNGDREALESLFTVYWKPVYEFFRAKGCQHEDAEELVQEVMAHVLERDALRGARPERGRFRSFLLTIADRQLLQSRRRESAAKRGGGMARVALDYLDQESIGNCLSSPADPRRIFEITWARTLLGKVLEQLRAEYTAGGKDSRFEILVPHLTPNHSLPPYAETAEHLNTSEGALKTAIYRLRKRYAQLLLAEITETVENPADAKDELNHLIRILQSP